MAFFDWTRSAAELHKGRVMMIGVFTTLLALSAPAEAGKVTGIDLDANGVTVRFDDFVSEASGFSLAEPDRVAIDIKGATDNNAVRARTLGESELVDGVRHAQFDPDTVRIVLDLNAMGHVSSAGFSPDGKSFSVVLGESSSSRLAELAGRRQSFLPPAGMRAAPPKDEYSVKVKLPPVKKGPPLPEIEGPAGRPLVVIDAGHGGHDPGAISPHGGTYEKGVTLDLVKAVKERLLQTGHVRVALTRDKDEFLVLEERFDVARKLDADLFISIHADAAGSEQAHGATVYTLSEVASDREAAKLASRENKADILNGVDLGGANGEVSSILIDLTQRETMNRSADFAKLVLIEGEGNMKFRSTSHRFASFVVLKAPDIPSILLEAGYLTNERDMKFLTSNSGRKAVAESMTGAVERYFARQMASR